MTPRPFVVVRSVLFLTFLLRTVAALEQPNGVETPPTKRPVIVYGDMSIADHGVAYEDISAASGDESESVTASVEDELLGSTHAAGGSVMGQAQGLVTETVAEHTLGAWSSTADEAFQASPPEKFQLTGREDALVAKLTAFLGAYFQQLQSVAPNRLTRGPPWAVNIILPRQFTDPLWYHHRAPPTDED